MKKLKLLLLFFISIHYLLCFAQPLEVRLDTMDAYELEVFLSKNCCASKDEFVEVKDEFIKRVENKEPVSVNMATRILERRNGNFRFFSNEEVNSFVKKLAELDISYDKHLEFEIYYQILKNHNIELAGEKRDTFLKNIFAIREHFYLELIQFQDFNHLLANKMRGIGDTVLFKRFNGDVLDDVKFSSLNIGDKPTNTLDTRISDKLFEIQMAAFWDRIDFFNRTGNTKALEDIRDSKNYLFQVLKAQPNFITDFNKILEKNNLDVIQIPSNSRIGN